MSALNLEKLLAQKNRGKTHKTTKNAKICILADQKSFSSNL